MRPIVLLLIILFSFSCTEKGKEDVTFVDLDDYEEEIKYSSFVDSLSYLTFSFSEDDLMGNVSRIYKWNDYYYIWASHRSGIFIYHKSGKLHARINSYGEGPENFREISSFTILASTGDVFIHDYASQRMLRYDKNGCFIVSSRCPFWCMDFLKFDLEYTLFMSPMYGGDENPSGIWMADAQNNIVRHLGDNVNEDHKFYYFPNMYNLSGLQAYHYDRNWDEFSVISQDSIQCLYRFKLKQKIPLHITGNQRITPLDLDGYGICDNFAYSSSCMLMNFCRFAYRDNKEERFYLWALFDNSRCLKLAEDLCNDMDSTIIRNRSLFYLDNQTWARVCDEDVDNMQIRLQVLHLK